MAEGHHVTTAIGRPKWPNQTYAIGEVARLRAEGYRRILVTGPTGSGKSTTMCEIIADERQQGRSAALYTNRKLLREQLSRVLTEHGIGHGIRASGAEEGLDSAVQVSSMPTEHSRVYRQKIWTLHPSSLVIIDEAHVQRGALAQRIMTDHLNAGATVVSFTATPLDIGGLYDVMVQAGTVSEMRAIGALVLADHYGPDEPDAKLIGKNKTGEYEIDGKVRAIWTQTIFGRVLSEWHRLNPLQKPTILFAPGVPESLWFAEQFYANGISAAHIDGSSCWFDGQSYTSNRKARDGILDGVRDGSIKVVCNRFVLREGIDIPELEHGILATVFGSLQSYIQSGGRLLRACPKTGKTRAVIQDHGGNWWRHGSINADRVWKLGDTARLTNGLREERLMAKTEREPIVCPKCFACRMDGAACWKCGYSHQRKSRLVVQEDGTLRERTGDIFKPRIVRYYDDTVSLWKKMFYRARHKSMTFRAAEGLFFVENHYYPPRDLPLMPTTLEDWFRPVNSIPPERLTR